MIEGDSGGGLAVAVDETWTLVGIVSVGKVIKKSKTDDATCDLSEYVLYTDVAKFHSWINRVIMETPDTTVKGVTEKKVMIEAHRDTMSDNSGAKICTEFSQNVKICFSTSVSHSQKT